MRQHLLSFSSKSKASFTSTFWTTVIPSFVTVTLCYLAYYRYQTSSSHESSSKNDNEDDSPTIDNSNKDHIINQVLLMNFEKSVEQSRNLTKNITQEEKLLLYALFKQAQFGNRPSSIPEPSRFQIVERAKYDAWGYLQQKNMSKEEAMVRYISVVQQLSQKQNLSLEELTERENADIVYDEEDEYASSDEDDCDFEYSSKEMNKDGKSWSGLGLSPSTLTSSSSTNELELQKHPLHQAASEGNLQQIQSILSSTSQNSEITNTSISSKINEKDDQGQTPLHLAVDRGNMEVIQFLIQNGANVNAVDNDGFSVVAVAVMAGEISIPVVKYLLDQGADVNIEDDDGESAMSWVKDEGSEELKELFKSIA